MNDTTDGPVEAAEETPLTRRSILKFTGAGVAALGLTSLVNIPFAEAGTMVSAADNFYKSDKVTVQKVAFSNQYKMKVVGNLFIPKGSKPNAKLPAIVVGHPMGAVKEQSANLYATKMAEQGFVAMSLDLPFWGESEGSLATRSRRTSTPRASAPPSISSVRRRSSTGTASGRSASAAAAASSSAPPRSTRDKAIATVSMYDMGAANRNGLGHSQTVEQRKKSSRGRRTSATWSSRAARPSTRAAPSTN